MSYNTFPTSITAPSYGLDEEVVFPQIATTFDDGTVQAQNKYTRARLSWTLQWDNMPEADYQILKAFFLANRSLRFYYTHPIDLVTRLCMFGPNNLKNVADQPGHRRTSISILEM
jgi:hypothetical protein